MNNYSEAAYFDGYHFQHIVAYQERNRIRQKQDEAQAIFRSMSR